MEAMFSHNTTVHRMGGWMSGWINIDYRNTDSLQILCLLEPIGSQVIHKLSEKPLLRFDICK